MNDTKTLCAEVSDLAPVAENDPVAYASRVVKAMGFPLVVLHEMGEAMYVPLRGAALFLGRKPIAFYERAVEISGTPRNEDILRLMRRGWESVDEYGEIVRRLGAKRAAVLELAALYAPLPRVGNELRYTLDLLRNPTGDPYELWSDMEKTYEAVVKGEFSPTERERLMAMLLDREHPITKGWFKIGTQVYYHYLLKLVQARKVTFCERTAIISHLLEDLRQRGPLRLSDSQRNGVVYAASDFLDVLTEAERRVVPSAIFEILTNEDVKYGEWRGMLEHAVDLAEDELTEDDSAEEHISAPEPFFTPEQRKMIASWLTEELEAGIEELEEGDFGETDIEREWNKRDLEFSVLKTSKLLLRYAEIDSTLRDGNFSNEIVLVALRRVLDEWRSLVEDCSSPFFRANGFFLKDILYGKLSERLPQEQIQALRQEYVALLEQSFKNPEWFPRDPYQALQVGIEIAKDLVQYKAISAEQFTSLLRTALENAKGHLTPTIILETVLETCNGEESEKGNDAQAAPAISPLAGAEMANHALELILEFVQTNASKGEYISEDVWDILTKLLTSAPPSSCPLFDEEVLRTARERLTEIVIALIERRSYYCRQATFIAEKLLRYDSLLRQKEMPEDKRALLEFLLDI